MNVAKSLAKLDAPGRLAIGKPVAIVDIGSNSVRLVAYEGLSRSPTPIFNDKLLCGLGRGVATTGKLPEDGVEKALGALRRAGHEVERKAPEQRDLFGHAGALMRSVKGAIAAAHDPRSDGGAEGL